MQLLTVLTDLDKDRLAAALVVVAAIILITAPVSGLERLIVRRAYGIPRAEVRSGRVRFVRNPDGYLIPVRTDLAGGTR